VIRRDCADLPRSVASPRVALSSGVTQDNSPTPWNSLTAKAHQASSPAEQSGTASTAKLPLRALLEEAFQRLRRLGELADRVVTSTVAGAGE
jgi:hypothetical protein